MYEEAPENWHGKPKDEYDDGRAPGFNLILLWVVVALVALLIGGAAAVAFARPDLLRRVLVDEAPVTQTLAALRAQQTRHALQMTADANDLRATQNVYNARATQEALHNQQALLAQTATRMMGDALAAQSLAAQQATLAALDRIQARSQEVTEAAPALLATQTAFAALNMPAPTGSPTPQPTPSTPATAPPLYIPLTRVEDDFSRGLTRRVWDFAPSDWDMARNRVLTAVQDRAWLLTRRSDFTTYTLEVFFTPPPTPGEMAFVLSLEPAGHSLAVRLVSDGQAVTQASLLNFSADRLRHRQTLLEDQGAFITAAPLDGLPLSGGLVFARIEVTETGVRVYINDRQALDAQLLEPPGPGAVGIQMPQETRVQLVSITPHL